ncbi:MAG: TPM domain-containing protein [Bacteroidales bacterium]
MNTAKGFFSPEQREDILHAIMAAELDTSGEIRVHIEKECSGEVMDRALVIFHKLGMQKTELRNGILFYLAVNNRKFAVLGDKGIHEKVGDDFWEMIRQEMIDHFRKDEFSQGLSHGILMAGEQLKKYYPYKRNDVNELPDDISFGN